MVIQIPILAGASPPKYPGAYKKDCDVWRLQADRFAAYCITLHRPWSVITKAPDIPLTHESFMGWIDELVGSNKFVDKARLSWIRHLAQGFSVPAQTLSILAKWRSRYAHVWNASDSEEIAAEFGKVNSGTADEEGFADQVLRELQETYEAIYHPSDLSEAELSANQAVKELRVFDSFVHASSIDVTWDSRRDQRSTNEMNRTYDSIITKERQTIIADLPSPHVSGVGLPAAETQRGRIVEDPDPSLNNEQNAVFVRAIQWLNADELNRRDAAHHPCPPPLHVFVNGQAGSGKSFLVRVLINRVGAEKVSCSSFMGIAASNLPRGTTINSEFAISISKGRSASQKTKSLARLKLRDVRIIIIGLRHLFLHYSSSSFTQMRFL